MKKNKLTLIFLIGIIALTTVSIASSVAWYATSTNSTIDAIDVTIDCDRQLYISTDKEAHNEKTEISYVELNPTTIFIPVTSAYRSTWMNEKKEAPIFYDDSVSYPGIGEQAPKAVTEGYFSQDIYLFSDDDVCNSDLD